MLLLLLMTGHTLIVVIVDVDFSTMIVGVTVDNIVHQVGEGGRARDRETTQREVDKLRGSIQTLTR